MSWVATAIIGAGAVGAAATAYSANTAASAQEQASQNAQATQLDMFNQTQAALAPFKNAGATAASTLTNELPTLTAPVEMTEANLEQTPGYQFTLQQGLQSVQNSNIAQGLGESGAALKGAATFATGLADNTYQQQFNNQWTNQQNAFNDLESLTNTGESAAAGVGTAASNAGNQISSAQIGSGNAAAAASNATGGAVNNLTNSVAGYAAYNGLYGGSQGGSNNPITQQVQGSSSGAGT